MIWVAHILYLVLAYLLGAIPFGFLMGKWLKGLDIRTVGSGNIGATNVFRALGPKPGAAVLALDIAKGYFVVGLLPGLLGLPQGAWEPLAGGLLAVLGHDYTCFLNFKGGKGVATSAGVLLGLAPFSTGGSILVFLAVFGGTRMISAGSLATSLALPLLMWAVFNEGHKDIFGVPNPVLILTVILAVFIWISHIPNIKRILKGQENRIGGAPKEGKGK